MVIWVIVLELALVALVSIWQTTLEAHDQGWEWDFPSVYPLVEDRTEDFDYYIDSAVQDYDDYTDLTVFQCADNGNCGILIHVQADYGDTGWYAKAHPYSNGVHCYNNPGYCNHSNHMVDFGYVEWNDHYGQLPQPGWIARHEMGHNFGLRHTLDDCVTWSVMREGGCLPNVANSLTSHD